MGNAQGRIIQIGIRAEKGRRLAPQLQGYRYQVICRGVHHLAPDLRRASEHQVIERQTGESLRTGQLAAEHGHLVCVENLGEHLLQHLVARQF